MLGAILQHQFIIFQHTCRINQRLKYIGPEEQVLLRLGTFQQPLTNDDGGVLPSGVGGSTIYRGTHQICFIFCHVADKKCRVNHHKRPLRIVAVGSQDVLLCIDGVGVYWLKPSPTRFVRTRQDGDSSKAYQQQQQSKVTPHCFFLFGY